jgi:hypothetical protein
VASNIPFFQTAEQEVPRPPNFKQEKRRREDAQKKRNQEKQQQKATRKDGEREPQKDQG